MRITFVVLSSIFLGGCLFNSDGPASILKGECKVFTDPHFAVQGKRLQDKKWIGETQEKGIKVCGWERPTK